MSDEFFLTVVFPLVFLTVGIVLLTTAAKHWTRTRTFVSRAKTAVGEVVGQETIPPQQPGSDEYESYAPVVVFKNIYGHDVRFTPLSSSYPARYKTGDRVPVLYTIDGSDEPRIHSFHDLWFLPTLLGGLGSIFTLIGSGILICGVPG